MVGPYWEKLCPLSRVRPSAGGLGPYSRPRAQFFPIRTSRPVNNIYILLPNFRDARKRNFLSVICNALISRPRTVRGTTPVRSLLKIATLRGISCRCCEHGIKLKSLNKAIVPYIGCISFLKE